MAQVLLYDLAWQGRRARVNRPTRKGSSIGERRRHWRFGAGHRVDYIARERRSTAFLANLSQGGALLRSASHLAAGDELDFTVHLDGGPTNLRGTVVAVAGEGRS